MSQSQVNPSFLVDGEQPSKAEMRDQFRIIRNEINRLFKRTNYARRFMDGKIKFEME